MFGSFKRVLRPAPVAAAVAALVMSMSAHAGGDPTTQTSEQRAAAASRLEFSDQLIIKYRKGTAAHARADLQTMAAAHAVVNQAGAQMRLLRRNAFEAHVMRLDGRFSVDVLERLARAIAIADPDVEYAEVDRMLQPQLTPTDARYLDQWHYYEATAGLRAPTAWDQATGTGVVVAVIDTGFRPHVDLAANLVAGYDMIIDTAVSNDGNGRDADASDPGDWVTAGLCGTGSPAQNSSWHGTHVAGTVAAVTNNGSGVAGVAFGARVQPVRALGTCGGYTSDIADGIVWASGGTVSGLPANPTPAKVINMSLGGGGACGATTQNAINSARGRGTVVVVAAGNSNANTANYTPASCAGVITVAAVNRSGGKSYYSNFGANVDVAAPGGDMRSAAANGVLSTLNSGTTTPGADTYAYYQGTSMAAPHVAGVAALMLARNPALTPDQVENVLKTTARAFPAACSQCGSGIVDASAAVAAAPGGGGGGGGGGTTVTEVESNNSRNTAQFVSANPATVNGSIASTSDTDYYRITLGAGKTLTATLRPPATADYDLYLYNANGAQIASSTLGTGQADTATYRNAGAASITVYARARYYSGGAGAYTLALSQ